ncbi:MAG: metal ABC transporter ATP-binding protein [Actinomycetota bacterium]
MSVHTAGELAGATVYLGQAEVLSSLDVAFRAGEFVALLGPNGSGKSTLVRSLLGVIPVASGRVRLFGAPLDKFRGWGRIGYVPQRFGAVSGVPATVEEVVLSGRVSVAKRLRGYGSADRRAAARALQEVDLSDLGLRRVSHLSGGQQQRVLIARALVNEPDLLVLDEPLSNLDLDHQRDFAKTLEQMVRSGATVILVAHALGAVEKLVDRAVVLEQGRIVHDGPPSAEHQHDHAHHVPLQEPLGGTGADQHRIH